jgi:hypothetical protein
MGKKATISLSEPKNSRVEYCQIIYINRSDEYIYRKGGPACTTLNVTKYRQINASPLPVSPQPLLKCHPEPLKSDPRLNGFGKPSFCGTESRFPVKSYPKSPAGRLYETLLMLKLHSTSVYHLLWAFFKMNVTKSSNHFILYSVGRVCPF